ncbi:mediterrocin family bacteriocin [Desulfosporosinus fructosivorans]
MKTRISRKKTVLLALSLCLSLAFPVTVYAESTLVHASRSGSSYFIDDWTDKATASYSGSTEKLDYGFDTTLINEDVAYAYSDGSRHCARIKNGSGTHNGTWVWANDTSDLEVQHSGTTVNYYSIEY